jgi:cobalt/nickel transport protein
MNCKLFIATTTCLIYVLGFAAIGAAHFGAIIPSDDIVTQKDPKKIQVAIKFLHPMEGHYMELVKPKQFGVLNDGKKTDLLSTLTSVTGNGADQKKGFAYWKTEYQIKRPGDYVFYMEPTPYWEPAEDKFIVHYTKVDVNALGKEEGWDSPLGLETEIIPKTRPYGLWVGNVFTGQVLIKGKPAVDVDVEVEYLNESKDNPKVVQPASDPFVTQVVKTDANGMFTYAMPRAGWWGFAALTTADWTIKKDGVDKKVETGAVYWVHATTMK